MTIRQSLLEHLRDVVAGDVVVLPYRDTLDEPERPTIIVKQGTYARLPEAPAGSVRVDYVLTFTSPAVDQSIAEPQLDEWIEYAIANYFEPSWIYFERADPVLVEPAYFGYDVVVYCLTQKENEE